MIKYKVNSFKEFVTCINNGKEMYIEKEIVNDPIPELIGVMIPFTNESGSHIAVCTKDENPDMEPKDFEKMIINLKLNDNAMCKIIDTADWINYYYKILYNYGVFVLDDIIERNMELNN